MEVRLLEKLNSIERRLIDLERREIERQLADSAQQDALKRLQITTSSLQGEIASLSHDFRTLLTVSLREIGS